MPCTCQQKCGEDKANRNVQPYRNGKLYCKLCKIFQDSNIKNRCFCCNGLLRTKTKSLPPERRKNKIWQWVD